MATRSRASKQPSDCSEITPGQTELFNPAPYVSSPAELLALGIDVRESKTWISTAELASAIGLHPNTIRNYVAAGAWPAHRVAGKLRFSPADVEAIEQLTRTSA